MSELKRMYNWLELCAIISVDFFDLYSKLMVVLKFYIADVTDLTKADALMRAMRSLDYIFKFIIYSRMRFAQ